MRYKLPTLPLHLKTEENIYIETFLFFNFFFVRKQCMRDAVMPNDN